MADGKTLIAIETLRIIAEKSYEYLRVMFANINRSENEKKSLSKSLVKTLRFDKYMGQRSLGSMINSLSETDNSLARTIEDFDDGDDDGMFEGSTEGREDGEQRGIPRAPFAGEGLDENRDRWGRRGRPQRDGEMPGYFGEEAAAEQPGVAAPLAMAGFDPAAQVPAADTGSLVEVLATMLRNDLRMFVTAPDDEAKLQNGDFEELVTKFYPDPSNFVSNVANAMEERGYTKPQVAAAMGQTSLPFFADYIARNGGEYGPAPIVPAYRYPPAGPQPGGAPFYGPPPPSGPPSVASRTSTTAMGSTAAAVPAWLSAYPSRAVLRQKLNSVEKVRAFMASVPAEAGLKAYTPRLSSNDGGMKSVHETLIRNIAQVVPNY
jgi:hypothetical protein